MSPNVDEWERLAAKAMAEGNEAEAQRFYALIARELADDDDDWSDEIGDAEYERRREYKHED